MPLPPRPRKAASVALVARQPIYGTAMTVVAYELQYAESGCGIRPPRNGPRDDALRMLADAALDIGLDRLAGALPVYIRYPRELLIGGGSAVPAPGARDHRDSRRAARR